ncbi:MAG: hypothetical protein JW941_00400 [Candidatus Coatesbacteria bacterium]|nr:hypothetical protein [Candidatus Coatesbacteria bacterium]
MNVYFAGANNYLLRDVFRGANIMVSYAWLDRALEKTIREGGFSSVMLDSGAFSAFRSGVGIDIVEYCDFIEHNLDRVDLYFNLDVIGDVAASKANLRFMEVKGLSPIPVFHHGEELDVLEEMRDGYPLIGLGGMVPRSRRRMFDWLSEIFGRYPHKYHGLGIGDVSLISTFPFESIDNTSWKFISRRKALKSRSCGSLDWSEFLTRKELLTISRKFYERLCAAQ